MLARADAVTIGVAKAGNRNAGGELDIGDGFGDPSQGDPYVAI